MKNLKSLIWIVLSCTLISATCKKQAVAPVTELSKLPPATQIGANTFGCLVNGQALLPGGNFFSGSHMQCNYIYTSGGYYFTVEGDNEDNNNLIKQVIIETDSLAITEGQTIQLKKETPASANASYAVITSNGNVNEYLTNNIISGQLIITKLDLSKQIVSGTFYFNAINSGGDTVKITNGRFDMLYTM